MWLVGGAGVVAALSLLIYKKCYKDRIKMDKKQIESISKAWQEVYEKKTLDPVDPKELKGKHKDREDGDIDNDGDTDSSDQYLHKKRKAISRSSQRKR